MSTLLAGGCAVGAVLVVLHRPLPPARLVRPRQPRRPQWPTPIRTRGRAGLDEAQVARDLPDLIDLLGLAVGAGLSVPAALAVVAPVSPVALRADLQAVVAAMAGGRPSDEAVAGLAAAWGPPARPLVHAIADHLRYGTPVLPALERVAVEARSQRRRAAEIRARKLPILLLFPLVLCTLPAFGLLIVSTTLM